MATEITMPKLGLTMDTGTIITWFKKEGERVEIGNPLMTVETDKVAIEVEAPMSGTLIKILVKENENVPVGAVIAFLGEPGEAIPEAANIQSVLEQQNEQKIVKKSPDNGFGAVEEIQPIPVSISPIARKLAMENSIDFSVIKGSGPGGRIVEADIFNQIEKRKKTESLPYILDEITPIKRLTSKRMAESFCEIPHFYLQRQLVVDGLVALREREKLSFEGEGVNLTYTDLLLTALAKTLPTHQRLNASFVHEEVHLFRDVNLGFAVSTPRGLVVVVIPHAQEKQLSEIVFARNDLTNKARDNNLSPEDVGNGTFTLTNLGMFGVDNFLPIINPPQSAILAVGAIREAALPIGHIVGLHHSLQLTLAVDHRAADGVDAAKFLTDFCEMIEKKPEELFH